MSFKDHFSSHAGAYRIHRPESPEALIRFIVSLCPEKKLAWDVGTGNGQAAISLAPHFDRVIATDASPDQIKEATPHPKITYRVGKAEDEGLVEPHVNLVTVAQALHWFNFDEFYKQVKKVATGGVIAAWTYDVAAITPEVDAVVREYYDGTLKEFWPVERKYVDGHYKTIPFPFTEISAPTFHMSEARNLAEWCGYLFTWSATQRAIKKEGQGVFSDVVSKLESAWGDPEKRRDVRWPLHLRVGRIDGAR